MSRPHIFIALLLTATAALCAASSAPARFAAHAPQQASEKLYETARSYYDAGEYQQALNSLESLLSADSSYAPAMLLKYKALVRLFAIAPPLLPPERESPESRLEKRARLAKMLKEAADSLERYLHLKPDDASAGYFREQLSALRVHSESAVKPESEWTIFTPTEVSEKARILHRPIPVYTEEARSAQVHGTVKLLAVLAADGTVRDILVLQSIGHGMTEASVEATRRIRFQPAVKDGRTVSQFIQIEYNFNLY